MNELNRANIRLLGTKIEAALEAVGKELGVSFQIPDFRFKTNTGTVKIKFGMINESGKPINKLEDDFKIHFLSHGIPEEYLGKQFKVSGRQFTLTGYRPKATKRPFVGKSERGKEYIFTKNDVLRGFERNDESINEDVHQAAMK